MTESHQDSIDIAAAENKPLQLPLDRPNLSLRVDLFSTRDEKRDALLRRIEFADKPGIVYVSTHKGAETVAAELQQIGVEAVFHHGGLKARDREEIHDRFLRGDVPVIVATNGLGVGMDKPDIRFIYHADLCESLDGYYQEIGCAGGDGQPAEAVLFYCPQDASSPQFKTSGRVDTQALETVAQALASHKRPATRADLVRETSLSARMVTNVVHKLQEVGAAKQLDSGKIKGSRQHSISGIAEAAASQLQQQRDQRRRRLQQMQGYAECRTCRREYLLRSFGHGPAGPCGNCDRCEQAGLKSMRVA